MRENEHRIPDGDRCGAYRIVRFIGAGRTAEVYQAVHGETGEPAAIRRLRAEHGESERMRRRMVEEAEILKKADHPNVAAVLGTGIHEGLPFTVLEHVVGYSLRERINQLGGRVKQPVSLCFIKQIADATAAIHAAGAFHGDLRPETIRLNTIDEVRLCDLGPGAPLSSPSRGDLRGDIRALGLILGEMLSGGPLKASTMGEQLATVPSYMRELIQKAVFGDASSWFASMMDVAEALDGAFSRLMTEVRTGKGLRQALDTLASALRASKRGAGKSGEAGADQASDAEEEDSEEEDIEALLKGVIDATKDLDVDPDDEGDEDEANEGPPTDRD